MVEYSETFMRLAEETAIVSFAKKDGTHRVMLCTRNNKTAALEFGNLGGLLDGHDKRCSIANKNMSVIDLALGECRAFNTDRVMDIKWLGIINDEKMFAEACTVFLSSKKEMEDKQIQLAKQY